MHKYKFPLDQLIHLGHLSLLSSFSLNLISVTTQWCPNQSIAMLFFFQNSIFKRILIHIFPLLLSANSFLHLYNFRDFNWGTILSYIVIICFIDYWIWLLATLSISALDSCGGGLVMSYSLRPHGLCNPPRSSVHGIIQARILKSVAIFFSRGSSQPRDWTHICCIAGKFFTTESSQKPILTPILSFKSMILL